MLADREDVEPDLVGTLRDRRIALMRSASLGVEPVTGSG